MTENPELLDLGVTIDPDTVATFEELRRYVEQLQNAVAEVYDEANDKFYQLASALAAVRQETFNSNAGFDNLVGQVKDLSAEFTTLAKSATDASLDIKNAISTTGQTLTGGSFAGYTVGQVTAGYGVSGGMIGPSEFDTGGGGGSSSLFGVAHGIRAASGLGRLAGLGPEGTAAFTGTADILYLYEGMKRLDGVLQTLNATITETPGLLTPLVSAFTAMEIPFAGILAVAVPIAAVIGAVVISTKMWNDAMESGRQAIRPAIDALDAYYKGIVQGSSATRDQLNNLTLTNEQRANEIANLKEMQQTLKPENFNADGLAKYSAKQDELQKKINDLGDASAKSASEIDGLKKSLTSPQTLAEDAAAFLAKANEFALVVADNEADYQRQIITDEGMKADELKKRRDWIIREEDVLNAELSNLKGNDAATQQKRDDLQNRIHYLEDEKSFIENNALISAQLHEQTVTNLQRISAGLGGDREAGVPADFNPAADRAAAGLTEVGKALSDLADKVTSESNSAMLRALDIRAKEAQDEQQYQEGSLQDTEARYQIALKESRDETKIRQDTADKITDIETKFSQKQQDLNRDLSRTLEDDGIRYQQNYGKIVRSANDQLIDDTIAHQQKLADLQRTNTLDIQNALLDRNFKEINQQKARQQDAIQQENTSYAQREDTLRRHTETQIREAGIAYEQQREQDMRAAARKLQDAAIAETRDIQQAQLAETRKIQLAQQSETQQLNDLSHTETYKIQLLRQSERQQLDLLAQQEQAKIALIISSTEQLIQRVLSSGAFGILGTLANGALNSPWARTIGNVAGQLFSGLRGFDQGGSFGAGEWFTMSENHAELLQMGMHSYRIGNSALVYSLQGGSVKPSGHSMTNTFYITSNDPEGVRREVTSALQEVMG